MIKMTKILCCVVLLTAVVTFTYSQEEMGYPMLTSPGKSVGDYQVLGKPCSPSNDTCFHGSKCNPETKICDCADSEDGLWKRTFQKRDCRLLPGSNCVQDGGKFYKCVKNAKCKQTRAGENPINCPADASCDTGDYTCVCKEGKKCLTKKRPARRL